MNPAPMGFSRINPAIFYQDANQAIDWLCRAFGFEIQLKVETDDGGIAHSELVYGDGTIMVGSAARGEKRKSPRAIDGSNTQSLMVFVDDVDAHYQHARESGASIVSEPKVSDYGEDYWSDRGYEAADIEGHRWWFVQRLRSPEKAWPKQAKE